MEHQLQESRYFQSDVECDFKLNVETVSMSACLVASFDPTVVAFGVAWSQQQKDKQVVKICLYGLEGCETGPFADWRKDYNQIKIMRFSNNGERILLATSDNSIVVLDTFQSTQICKITNFLNESSIIECNFTPENGKMTSPVNKSKQIFQLLLCRNLLNEEQPRPNNLNNTAQEDDRDCVICVCPVVCREMIKITTVVKSPTANRLSSTIRLCWHEHVGWQRSSQRDNDAKVYKIKPSL